MKQINNSVRTMKKVTQNVASQTIESSSVARTMCDNAVELENAVNEVVILVKGSIEESTGDEQENSLIV